jgi:thiol-disulfide isomerase/thioredoxin
MISTWQRTIVSVALLFLSTACLIAQQQAPTYTAQEQPIFNQIKSLRSLPDDVRAKTTKDIALEIRSLSASSPNKLRLAEYLASRATEGDFGHDALQEVTNTLQQSLQQQPPPEDKGKPAGGYTALAELARYEHMQVSCDAPQYKAAMAKLEADDAKRQDINFTLTDLNGKTWTLKDLKGKVVMVNFWATWCPPCQKEMPDLEALYKRYKGQGFVILALSEDDETEKVAPFVAERNVTYPIFLDPGQKIGNLFQVNGIPKSFVYNRDGVLVTESIDMRTRRQFEEMLAQAGLK